MKVTFVEEIEAHKAWTNSMICPKCGGFRYKIHHQIQPQPDQWWIECDVCGLEDEPTPTRDTSIIQWKSNGWWGTE